MKAILHPARISQGFCSGLENLSQKMLIIPDVVKKQGSFLVAHGGGSFSTRPIKRSSSASDSGVSHLLFFSSDWQARVRSQSRPFPL